MSNTGQAWVTLVTNDSYALGALVLAQSLRRNNTIYQLAVLITPGVSPAMRQVLTSTFDLVKEVDVLDSKDAANLALLARPDLGITFTKLHCWNLTQYTKCVFLDADTLVVKNCDELFEREELSAAPDAGWPDCFNSGVFVFKPSEETFKSLLDFALKHGSFDGGDQGLLNMFFNDWATKDITKHLPFIYNMVASATYSYLPAFKVFGSNVKVAHFIGSNKPWLQAQQPPSTLSSFLELWWRIFQEDVAKSLNTDMAGLAGAMAGGQRDVIEDQWRKQSWEQGNIDYLGADAFENIWKKISSTVGEAIKPLETPVPIGPEPTSSEAVEATSPPAEAVAGAQPQEVPVKTEDKTELQLKEEAPKALEQPKPQEAQEKPQPDAQSAGTQAQTTEATLAPVEPAPTLGEPAAPASKSVTTTEASESPLSEQPQIEKSASEPTAKPEPQAVADPLSQPSQDTAVQVTPSAPVGEQPPVSQEASALPQVDCKEAKELETKAETAPVLADLAPASPPASSPAESSPAPVIVPTPAPSEPTPVSSEPTPAPEAPPQAKPASESPVTPASESPATPAPELPAPPAPELPTPPAPESSAAPAPELPASPAPGLPVAPEAAPVTELPAESVPAPKPPVETTVAPEPKADLVPAAQPSTPVSPPVTSPASPSVPSPSSPAAPEGTATPSSPPTTATPGDDATQVAAEALPQTPTGEAPVPPKRRSTKAKGKK
ncbi:Glycosyl transferase family 8 [Nesidiocoris tenuis]|uniref:glycogenin glucosyltransferase n=1 Tax=Nesidiocoris tenuis TaxID=355587 RepID=A0ABN7AIL6_9HEMI|nr:Glycosyl transferase family 8 [Nesidiocoris tenuis]